jgi:hypothetical protein
MGDLRPPAVGKESKEAFLLRLKNFEEICAKNTFKFTKDNLDQYKMQLDVAVFVYF